MKRFIRRRFGDIIFFSALVLIYVDALALALDIHILGPIGRAAVILCLLAYILYHGEINRKAKELAKRRKREEKLRQIDEEFMRDYELFKMTRVEEKWY